MAVIFTNPFFQFLDNNGNPLANGYVRTYAAGTTTNKSTFTTAAGDIENANPIPLDASGRPDNTSIFLVGSYDFALFDADDNQIDTVSNITAFNTTGVESDAFFQSFSGTGAQTAFTLSQDLGTDEKGLNIFIDDSGWSPVDPNDYTVDGTSLTFDTAPATGTDNIYVYSPTQSFGAAASAAAEAQASEAAALVAKNEAEAAAGLLDISSTSSVLIGTGSKTFTIGSGLGITAGQFVLIDSDADGANYMYGQITSYSGTTLIVNVLSIGGSGTLADWTITLIGIQGIQGLTGSISDLSGVPTATPTLTDTAIFTDVSDSNTTKKATIGDILDLTTSGGWVPIQTQTVSTAVASVDFTTGIDSTYKAYAVIVTGFDRDGAGANPLLRFGSGSFSSSGYRYSFREGIDNTATVSSVNSSSDSSIPLATNIANSKPNDFIIYLFDPASSLNKNISLQAFYYNGANFRSREGGGSNSSVTGSVDRLQFLMDSGNITAGTFTLYGLAGA